MTSLIKKLRIFQENKGSEDEKCTICLSQKIFRRRTLHFNDGIMGGISDDDEPYTSAQATGRLGVSALPRKPWLWYVIANTGSTLLKVLRLLGRTFRRTFWDHYSKVPIRR
jgi:hypothetical protein